MCHFLYLINKYEFSLREIVDGTKGNPRADSNLAKSLFHGNFKLIVDFISPNALTMMIANSRKACTCCNDYSMHPECLFEYRPC